LGGENEKLQGARAWQRWAFAIVPAVGLLELGAHVVQTHSVVSDDDWRKARGYVATQVAQQDLVAFAPRWADPIGRELFGPSLATLEREGRPDETRYLHAFEVSIRGAHLPALLGWRRAFEQRFGGVTVTRWDNPTPAHVLDDLVSMVVPARVRVSRVDGARDAACPFSQTGAQSGSLGFGPAVPDSRFVCPGGGFVGVSVMADPDYYPRRCIYAPPQGGGSLVRLTFLDVQLGSALHGHHGLYVEAEHRKLAPVTIVFKVGDAVVGSVIHHDGDGWKPFEFDTSALAGQRANVVAEIGAASSEWRSYCFEADTR
jgi:hypothetical protein